MKIHTLSCKNSTTIFNNYLSSVTKNSHYKQ